MVEAYKILKSLMKNLKRLVMHLGIDEEHHRQNKLQAITTLVNEALSSMMPEGDLSSLISTCSKKD